MKWEQRWHPLREEWIIVAGHRQNRPWTGKTVQPPERVPEYDASCYLCPGNARVGGVRNDDYSSAFVFDNDHPCVGVDAPEPDGVNPPYQVRRANGIARVVCYSPRHDVTLAGLEVEEIDALLSVWQEQCRELAARPEVAHVLIFENKGKVTGVSNPHPHCQIYATNFPFKFIETEARVSAAYLKDHGRPLFADILRAELEDGRRIVFENANAVVFVPWFARYAFEVFVAPRVGHASLADLDAAERRDLAEAMQYLVRTYDALWGMPFPYVMALHEAPVDGSPVDGFHFHIEFHPPLRKPNLLKHLAGPEIGGGNFVADTAPEDGAAALRAAAKRWLRPATGSSLDL